MGDRWRYDATVIYEGDTVPTAEAAKHAAEDFAERLGGKLHVFEAQDLVDPQDTDEAA